MIYRKINTDIYRVIFQLFGNHFWKLAKFFLPPHNTTREEETSPRNQETKSFLVTKAKVRGLKILRYSSVPIPEITFTKKNKGCKQRKWSILSIRDWKSYERRKKIFHWSQKSDSKVDPSVPSRKRASFEDSLSPNKRSSPPKISTLRLLQKFTSSPPISIPKATSSPPREE